MMPINMISFLFLIFIPLTQAGWPQIYSGEHFFDVMGTPMDYRLAGRTGVLVLYSPICQNEVNPVDLDLQPHLVYLTHDYNGCPRHTWYKYREIDDLYKKYVEPPGGQCLNAFYFEKGGSLDKPAAVWNRNIHPTINDWVWNLLEANIKIVNVMTQRLFIKQIKSPGGPELNVIDIYPGHAIQIKTYITYILHITDEAGLTVYSTFVTKETPSDLTVNGYQGTDVATIQEEAEKERRFWDSWIWTHADRHLRNLKQPLLLKNFTAIPYKQTMLPPELYKVLRNFYIDNKGKRYTETTLHETDSIIRHESLHKQPTLIPLPPELFARCERELTPILEEWCNCKLSLSDMYGIREYYEGNVLHHHVDRVSTHVIGIILQIDQDLGGEEDWLLEVIDYNGDRKHVKLEPGGMLMYESAKLIHGRPRALRGKSFANAFMHYKPVSGWDYDFDLKWRFFFSPALGINEPLTPFFTELTSKKKIYPFKTEL